MAKGSSINIRQEFQASTYVNAKKVNKKDIFWKIK